MGTGKHFLLLGAGFSRNWGGWLASEVLEYLLGHPEIVPDAELTHILWKHKRGGFEAALEAVQIKHSQEGSKTSRARLDRFQGAIKTMFHDMNSVFDKITNFEPAHPPLVGKRVVDFLVRFDAIFTLNQDLLLERHYERNFPRNSMPLLCSHVSFPGISSSLGVHSLLDRRWEPNGQHGIAQGAQPIFKLHGSSQWVSPAGDELLIMGGNKSPAIQKQSVLRWYHECFAEYLATTDSRLMIIGYSFGDNHINSIIENSAKNGLRIFIIDPRGGDVLRTQFSPGTVGEPAYPTDRETMLIGASRRSLREIFGGDEIERAKVMRFFTT